jgi:hypothetical protein
MLAMRNHQISMLNHKLVLTQVRESVKNNLEAKVNWCNAPGDKIEFYSKEGMRLFASFDSTGEPTFYVYIEKTGILYETGKFVLSIILEAPKTGNANSYRFGEHPQPSKEAYINSKSNFSFWNLKSKQFMKEPFDLSLSHNNYMRKHLLFLKDVTDIVIEKNASINTQVFLSVCDLSPKIKEAIQFTLIKSYYNN